MATITVEPSGEVIYLGSGETVLGGLYKAGYSYTVGCRRGGCGICKVDLVSGAVEYPTTVADTVLTPDERLEGTCLSRRAVPTGDVTFSLDGTTLKTVTLASAQKGKVSYTYPKIAKAGTLEIRISYAGNSRLKSATSDMDLKVTG